MASTDDPIPSLAALRRKSRRPGADGPSLFDLLPSPEPLAPPAPPPARVQTTSAPPRPPAPDVPPPPPPAPRVWSVGELVRQVRSRVEQAYPGVSVEGEISNWRPAGSGHCYFTLKDAQAQLSIVMFRNEARRLRFAPRDGDAVRITGQLSVYEQRGQMQLVAARMEQVGLGAMLAAVRELKERLRREGLFDRRRALPPFPRCIGVVTSLQGAALRDIVKVCRRRHAGVNLLVYPAAVQGPRCAIEVTRGLRWFSAHPDRADVVIVARGGGSWEDLHGFDDERVVRAIAASAVPVISGIGHATDSVLADSAADVCAPTPSAAAELVTAAQHRVEERIDRLSARVLRAGRFELMRAQQRFSRFSVEMVLKRAQDGLGRRAQRLDELEFRAENAARRNLRERLARVERLENRLSRRAPAVVLAGDRRRAEAIGGRLERAAKKLVAERLDRVERATLRLDAMSPLRVLERGYALVFGPDGKVLRSSQDISAGQQVTARLRAGRITATVSGKSP